mmetsp:Transcript_14033/g.30485  ORF Transcript_14033/g.30485 Transcript_14033/m.30485 type:complete len:309 (-) Transcript_14033:105-1031(-)|eukprot:CAMPEP_0178644254 /NCGR_PEP_ID=MMETSP0698-20121128/18186_1 /TAXON_ID=265572 /ORGANISM="Extubocellulus spinifer, Strain CCMP396" /LENGTH=308 /DNA_ID=CAMNT_0020285217 /DNA_START=83 /DNA_END=1009 /DNA_ORIENTATION=-
MKLHGAKPLLPTLLIQLLSLMLLQRLHVARGYSNCIGCDEDQRRYASVFPAWGCLVDDEDRTPRKNFGTTTPDGINECGCHFAQVEDFDIPNAMMPRFPHYCKYNEAGGKGSKGSKGSESTLRRKSSKAGKEEGPGVDSCACSISYDEKDFCPQKSRCDYAWTCGDTQYVCWDVIDPKDIDLFADGDPDSPECGINEDVTTVVYCGNDLQDNLFNLYPNDEDPCGDICEWDMIIPDDPGDLIGEMFICPNGQTLTRFTEFCTPDDVASATEPPSLGCTDCSLPFCDYQGREFITTHYGPHFEPDITCP